MIVDDHEIPFVVKNGLTSLDCWEPSLKDIEKYPNLVVTSDIPWEPEKINGEGYTLMNSSNNKVSVDKSIQDVLEFVNQYSRNLHISKETVPPDLGKAHRNMGWLPRDILKMTFDATTQLAKFGVRLPMRHHMKSPYPLNIRIILSSFWGITIKCLSRAIFLFNKVLITIVC